MSITIYANKVTGYDTDTGTQEFTLESEDDKVSHLTVDTFVTLERLDDLFDAIREAVKIMDADKIVGAK